MKISSLFPALFLSVLLLAGLSFAAHYPSHVITGNNMTVLILAAINPAVDGRPLEQGDEIAAFTPDGQFAGSQPWKGSGHSIVMTVWGQNTQSKEADGMRTGDSIRYRIWDSANQRETFATVTYNTTGITTAAGASFHPISGGTYVVDGISILASLTGTSRSPAPTHFQPPQKSGSMAADSESFVGKINPGWHYPAHVITGNNMIVLVPSVINPTINGRPLEKGDEIAAFSPEGQFAGAQKWRGAGKNIALTVWGHNLQTRIVDGMQAGDSIHYRIWDSAHQAEVPATVTYNSIGIRNIWGTFDHPTAGGTYVIDGISFLASLAGKSGPPAVIRLLFPPDSAAVVADSAAFLWTRGPAGIDRYIVEAAGDSALSAIVFKDTLVDTTFSSGKFLTRGATYWWRVKGHGEAGWTECTALHCFRIGQ